MTFNRGDIVTVTAIGWKKGSEFLVVEDWSEKGEPRQVLITGTSGNGNDGKCLVAFYDDIVMIRPFIAGE